MEVRLVGARDLFDLRGFSSSDTNSASEWEGCSSSTSGRSCRFTTSFSLSSLRISGLSSTSIAVSFVSPPSSGASYVHSHAVVCLFHHHTFLAVVVSRFRHWSNIQSTPSRSWCRTKNEIPQAPGETSERGQSGRSVNLSCWHGYYCWTLGGLVSGIKGMTLWLSYVGVPIASTTCYL